MTGPPCEINLNGKNSYPGVSTTLGITIAEQLVTAGMTWKTYQENLPITGPDNVNYSDGNFTNLTNFSKIKPAQNPPLIVRDMVQLYASSTIRSRILRISRKAEIPRSAMPTWRRSMESVASGAICFR